MCYVCVCVRVVSSSQTTALLRASVTALTQRCVSMDTALHVWILLLGVDMLLTELRFSPDFVITAMSFILNMYVVQLNRYIFTT